MTRQEEMIAGLRGNGYRQTPQRLAIVRILADDPTHPTVEQVFHQVQKDFPTTSLATVYKTIDTLKELGEVQELEFTDGGRRYDAMNVTPHAHLICRGCDVIEDYDIQVERLRKRAEESSTYEITDTRVDFYGLCRKCKGKSTKKSGSRPALVGAR